MASGAQESYEVPAVTEPAATAGDAAEAESKPPDPLIGQTVADRYEVESLLGSGGMGSVYRARHIQLRKPVALKVLHGQMTLIPEVVARFEREAVAAARIDHPNVATATDFGTLGDDSFFLVLEYVDGISLSKLVEEGPLPPARAVRIATQIAQALVAAHAAGIVHRDLKPDNVMLVEKQGDPDFVKVLDFGIAKLSAGDVSNDGPDSQKLTRVGTVFGTPEYMAPEQAAGQPVDERGDVYALGIIIYEMLAGRVPFSKDTIPQTLAAQIAEPPPPFETSDPNLGELVHFMLAKDRDMRPQSVSAVIEQLDVIAPALEGLPPASATVAVASPTNPVFAVPESNAAGAYSETLVGGAPPESVAAQTVNVPTRSHKKPPPPVWLAAVGGAVLVVGGIAAVGLATCGGTSEEAAAAAPSAIAPPKDLPKTGSAGATTVAGAEPPPASKPAPDPGAPTAGSAPKAVKPDTAGTPPKGSSNNTSSTTTSKTSSKTTTGSTTTNKTTTKTTTSSKTTSSSKSGGPKRAKRKTPKKKRKTVGGIYIPPPSQWFK